MVSCLTVTRNRVGFLKRSIDLFIQQDYNPKELVIIYYADDLSTKEYSDSFINNGYNIRFIECINSSEMTLGDIRNYGIDRCKGDWICIWDDDDEYASNRISACIEYCNKMKLDGTLLRRLKVKYNNEVRISPDRFMGWEGSLICKSSVIGHYDSLDNGEDTPLLYRLYLNDERILSFDNPSLYTYNIHESNTNKNLIQLFNDSTDE